MTSAYAIAKTTEAFDNLTRFQHNEPQVFGWIESATRRGFDFAASLRAAIIRYGDLTEKQYDAAVRCMAQDQDRAEGRTVNRQAQCNAQELDRSMKAAKASGLRKVVIVLDRFQFKLAPDHGKNPGAIYVTDQSKTYLGKVLNGVFTPSRDCGDVTRDAILKVAQDPHAAAVAYGKRFGVCSCCQRTLSDPESISLGIGPICRTRFGW